MHREVFMRLGYAKVMMAARQMAAATALAVLLGVVSLPAAVIEIVPQEPSIAVGGPAVLDVRVSGLGSGIPLSLGVFDIDVQFNPALLSFSRVAWGNQLDVVGLGSIRSATPGFGVVNLFELSLDSEADLNSLQLGEFLLARLTLTGIGIGTSPLTLGVNSLGDGAGQPLATSVVHTSVTVSEIPEPASIVLILVPLLSLAIPRDKCLPGEGWRHF